MSVAVIGALAPVFFVAVDFFVVRTTVTSRGHDAERWISQILRRHHRRLHKLIVGLDVEWRAGDNVRHPVAVLQICVGFRCLVFQVLHTDFLPANLVAFLLDHRFTFVGVGIQNDVERLAETWNLHVGNTVDLCPLAANTMLREDLRNLGFHRLAEEVLGLVVEKPRRIIVSNWERYMLSYEQIAYACADAFLSFQIGKRLRHYQF